MAGSIIDGDGGARVLISPYVQEVETAPVAARLRALHGERARRLVYDLLASTFVVMDEADHARLSARRWSGSRGSGW